MIGILWHIFLRLYGSVAEWFTKDQQVPHDEILERMNKMYGPFKLDTTRRGNGPTKYYINDKGQLFGIVHNYTNKERRKKEET